MEDERNQTYPVRRVFEEKEEKSRTEAVYQLYLNPSEADQALHLYHMDPPRSWEFWEKNKRMQILKNIGNQDA